MNAPRPWHRSRLFWLGIPGLLFLLWLWFLFESMVSLSWGNPTTLLRLGYQPGALYLDQTTFEKGSSIAVGSSLIGFKTQVVPIAPADRNYFRWRLQLINRNNPSDPYHHFRRLTLPFWFLVPLYLTTWLLTLTLWQRRKHRLAKAITPLP